MLKNYYLNTVILGLVEPHIYTIHLLLESGFGPNIIQQSCQNISSLNDPGL